MGQIPVVGDEQQAGGILVQPASGEKPPAAQVLREQVQHGLLAAVLRGGEHPRRLIHHNIQVLLPKDRVPPHCHRLAGRVHLGGRVPHGDTIHGHCSRADEAPHLLAGALPLGRQKFIQPFHHAFFTSLSFRL